MPHHSSRAPLDHPLTGKDEARASDYLVAGRVASRDSRQPLDHSQCDGARRPRAVVLDRDPAILEILGELLRDEDYDVLLSTECVDGETVAVLDPDVIVADASLYNVPTGQCLCNTSLTRRDGSEIPVIFSTTKPEVAARLADRGMPILLKPFDLDTLLALLGQAPLTDN